MRELHRGQADIERIADDGGLRRRSVLDDERAILAAELCGGPHPLDISTLMLPTEQDGWSESTLGAAIAYLGHPPSVG